jgi:hypothetical protein
MDAIHPAGKEESTVQLIWIYFISVYVVLISG